MPFNPGRGWGQTASVYLMGSAAEATAMGGTPNRCYSTFQTAYDAANTLQVALGGTTIVTIHVGPTTAAGAGNLVLTAAFNRNIRIAGISPYTSVLGTISTNNAAGTAFSMGTSAALPVFISNVTIGNITLQATGTTGNGGAISLVLADAVVGAISTNTTNASNTTGTGGAVFLSGTNTMRAVTGNIVTSAQSTAAAGGVQINATLGIFGAITTATGSNTGGLITISNADQITSISCITGTANSHNITNIKNIASTLTLTQPSGNITITTVQVTGTTTVTSNSAALTVRINSCMMGAYTTNLGTATKFNQCLVSGTLTNLGTNSAMVDTTLMGLTGAVVNATIASTATGITIDRSHVSGSLTCNSVSPTINMSSFGSIVSMFMDNNVCKSVNVSAGWATTGGDFGVMMNCTAGTFNIASTNLAMMSCSAISITSTQTIQNMGCNFGTNSSTFLQNINQYSDMRFIGFGQLSVTGTTEFTLLTSAGNHLGGITFPADTIPYQTGLPGAIIRTRACGVYNTSATPGTLTLQAGFDDNAGRTVTVAVTGLTPNTVNGDFSIDVDYILTNNSPFEFKVFGYANFGKPDGTVVRVPINTGASVLTIDPSVSHTMDIRGSYSNSDASNNLYVIMSTIDKLGAPGFVA